MRADRLLTRGCDPSRDGEKVRKNAPAIGRWQAEARPTIGGTRVAVVGHALACPAPIFFSASDGRGPATEPRALASGLPQAIMILVPILLAAAFSGCGYHIAGNGTLIPKNVRTVAVRPFGNSTQRYKLASMLPADISREFLARTRYRLVEDPNQADAVLTGALTNFWAYPIISAGGQATTVQAIVTVQVRLTDRATGKVLYERQGAEYRERYEISVDPAAYFDESGTGMQRLSKDVARGVLSGILNSF
jgi:hypothetical protein